ncbi:shikimate kinase [Myroides sp. WP-1]|uniref:shikimate kinase n=1 Tax=Myroides sp. WP-1 TaxID=2759944 RepID=UPI0015F9719E|nr:shikimate kinase [Myroides sp. WP-1]MBB1139347.1 AAA family ATPase [Myroides sp. WP-1]
MEKIIILGYMGAGKSTIAQQLAQELHLPCYDLDLEIEKQQQQKISTIFSTKGEVFFRKLEHQLLHQLINKEEKSIISLGGGTPCYANNHLVLQLEQVQSFYLKASISTLTERLEKEKEHRPMLQINTEDTLETFIAKHLFDRSYFYYQAKHIVTVDDKSINQVVHDIRTVLNY